MITVDIPVQSRAPDYVASDNNLVEHNELRSSRPKVISPETRATSAENNRMVPEMPSYVARLSPKSVTLANKSVMHLSPTVRGWVLGGRGMTCLRPEAGRCLRLFTILRPVLLGYKF